jgi:hypothetical protein
MKMKLNTRNGRLEHVLRDIVHVRHLITVLRVSVETKCHPEHGVRVIQEMKNSRAN